MKDSSNYRLRLEGRISEAEINGFSPVQVTLEEAGPNSITLAITTDQSGLIGLLECLHGLGFTLLALTRLETP